MYRKEDISIGMFDMDNFKSINELLGYKIGDEFIKALSDDISSVAEKHGVDAYRFGGDEFVVLLFSDMKDKEKEEVLDEIFSITSKNEVITRKGDTYLLNAESSLEQYDTN